MGNPTRTVAFHLPVEEVRGKAFYPNPLTNGIKKALKIVPVKPIYFEEEFLKKWLSYLFKGEMHE